MATMSWPGPCGLPGRWLPSAAFWWRRHEAGPNEAVLAGPVAPGPEAHTVVFGLGSQTRR
jgi:hypothetical protein